MATKKKTTAKKNEVAVRDDVNTLPVAAGDYADFAGDGYDGQTSEDVAIPFINLLQAMSPEVQDDGVEDARPGMLIDSVTGELYKEFEFTPAFSQHVYVEWIPRDAGGGIVTTHGLDSDIVKAAKARSAQFGKYTTEDGNDLVETFYLFGIVSVDGSPRGMAVQAFTSTKIKAYKAAMTRLRSYTLPLEDGRRISPPMFAHLLKVTTKQQKNTKGSFYVPSLVPAVENDVAKSLLPTNDIRFQMAKECYELVKEGKATADTKGQEAGAASVAGDPEEDMPF